MKFSGRVLHLRSSAGFWGPERQISQFAPALARLGYETHVICLYRRPAGGPAQHPLMRAIADAKTEPGPFLAQWSDPGWNLWPIVERLAGLLHQQNFEILHTHDYKSNWIGWMATRQVGIPMVASVRGYTQRTPALRLYRMLDGWLLRRGGIEAILPVSEAMRRELADMGVPRDHMQVVYDALDPDWFANRQGITQEELPSNQGDVVMFVGRLAWEKGADLLLQAVPMVRAQHPRARFWIVGTGPDESKLRRFAQKRGGMDEREVVHFTGYRSDVLALMQQAALLVVPSRREAFGDVILEGMAARRAVVAAKVGGIPEIVVEGETGRLVPPEAAGALAKAINELLADPVRRERMGQAGFRRLMGHFQSSRLAKTLAEVYGDITR
ncbi:MAG: glycosyltransferase family 4 protein [Chloroflexi bacterium]|nr:glycosyltransferase family 4 protein [Chloroflexota bacterium]